MVSGKGGAKPKPVELGAIWNREEGIVCTYQLKGIDALQLGAEAVIYTPEIGTKIPYTNSCA